MAWRVAKSLDTLLAQLNARAPKRSKVSDGSIGDAAHASRSSDHNPWVKSGATGIVTARDYSHDPASGMDCNWLAAQLVASGDQRIKYVIWNRRIYTPGRGWAAYKGINPHDKHLHLSVQATPGLYDSAAAWSLTASGGPIGNPSPAPSPAPTLEDDMYGTNERTEVVGRLDEAIGYLRAIHPAVAALQVGVLDPTGGLRTIVLQLAGRPAVQVDAAELATTLVPLLTPALAAKTGASKADVEAVIRGVLGGLDGVTG